MRNLSLVQVARALREEGLEAVLIGNAAAAIQGAPVTTLDINFLFSKTPANIAKLKRVAKTLGGWRVWLISSVVSGRPVGRGIVRCSMSSKPLSNKKRKKPGRKEILEALKMESEADLQDQIRRLLAKPPGERTHFLRRKIGITGSCL